MWVVLLVNYCISHSFLCFCDACIHLRLLHLPPWIHHDPHTIEEGHGYEAIICENYTSLLNTVVGDYVHKFHLHVLHV